MIAEQPKQNWIIRHRSQLFLAARLLMSVVATYVVTRLIGIPQPQWAVLTALIVTQGSVGGSIKASGDRFIGTVAGAIWGGAIGAFVPHTDAIGLGEALVMAIGPLAFLTAMRPGLRVAPITAIIVLMAPTGTTVDPVESAAIRLFEIGIGCLVGLITSLIVLPVRSRQQMGNATNNALQLMGELMSIYVASCLGTRSASQSEPLEAALQQHLDKFTGIAAEAMQERKLYRAIDYDPAPVFRTIMRLRHDLVIIQQATHEPLPTSIAMRLGPALNRIAAVTEEFFHESGLAIEGNAPAPSITPVELAIDNFNEAFDDLRNEGGTRTFPSATVKRLFSLGHGFEQLLRHCTDFNERTKEWVARCH
ncbi:FUSC family protein [Pseudovibrio sp. SPO723]|uniref:FUSC family protein n=1 Tax=Nesiotobacter zosterae TaxID=392721 RepID=UPI0029C3C4EA|nr:FUSC family protein [Pseudovibrio sp. SPO723]MDX5595562.1 FUSC family protein [Pseudovibrio sp. SPO723]